MRNKFFKKAPRLDKKTRTQYKQTLIEQYGLICAICCLPIENEQVATLDHKVARILGGTNNIENLQLAHAACNWKKGTQEQEEFKRKHPEVISLLNARALKIQRKLEQKRQNIETVLQFRRVLFKANFPEIQTSADGSKWRDEE